jgi:hypothetical protein
VFHEAAFGGAPGALRAARIEETIGALPGIPARAASGLRAALAGYRSTTTSPIAGGAGGRSESGE